MRIVSPVDQQASPYVRALTDAAVPPDVAVIIARAIARFDVQKVTPNQTQLEHFRAYREAIQTAGLEREGIFI